MQAIRTRTDQSWQGWQGQVRSRCATGMEAVPHTATAYCSDKRQLDIAGRLSRYGRGHSLDTLITGPFPRQSHAAELPVRGNTLYFGTGA